MKVYVSRTEVIFKYFRICKGWIIRNFRVACGFKKRSCQTLFNATHKCVTRLWVWLTSSRVNQIRRIDKNWTFPMFHRFCYFCVAEGLILTFWLEKLGFSRFPCHVFFIKPFSRKNYYLVIFANIAKYIYFKVVTKIKLIFYAFNII